MELKEIIKTDELYQTLRVSISGEWNIERLSKIVDSFNILYCNSLLIEVNEDDITYITGYNNYKEFAKRFLTNYQIFDFEIYKIQNDKFIEYFHGIDSRSSLSQNLLISSIEYNSPGKIDLLWIGKVIDSLSKLLKYYLPNKRDRVQVELEKQKLFEMRISSLKKLGLTNSEIQKIVMLEINSNNLLSKVFDKKLITNIEIKEEN